MKFLILLLMGCPAFAATFTDYPVVPMTPVAVPALHGARLKLFHTRAYDMLKKYEAKQVKPLAGRYVFDQMGCGTECVVLLGLDLKTGEFKIWDRIQAFDIHFRPNSRLLLINKGGLHMTITYPEQQYVLDDDFNLQPVN